MLSIGFKRLANNRQSANPDGEQKRVIIKGLLAFEMSNIYGDIR